MKTTKRFEDAVTKLYTAFHNNELNAFDCKHCAVGNICDVKQDWFIHHVNKIKSGIIELTNEESLYSPPRYKDYSEDEIVKIEYVFLSEWAKEKSKKGGDKEIQFKGLCAVVEYLCELDNIPNVMDFTSLFYTEDNKAVNQLQFN